MSRLVAARRALRRAPAGLAAMALLVAAACGTSSGEDEGFHGAGTVIVDGLEVQDGSRLLGQAFPGFEHDGQRLWTAVLLVDGDPAEVFDRYVTALSEIGIPIARQQTHGCTNPPGDDPFDPPRYEGEPAEIQEQIATFPIQCPAYGGPVVDPGFASLTLWHTGLVEGGPWAAHLVLQIVPPSEPRRLGADSSEVGPPPGALDDPGPMPDVADVGEPIAHPDLDPGTDLRLVPGSRLLAPPAPAGGTGGWTAVVAVTGDPQEVVDAYLGQSGDEVLAERFEAEGRPVIRRGYDQAGGVKLWVTAMPDDAGDWYALIDVAND